MQKQSSRIYYRGKDHKDVFFCGNYHCAMYLRGELVWEKYLDGVWVYNEQFGASLHRIKTLDPIKREIKNQAYTGAPYMTCGNDCYVVYSVYSIARYSQSLCISNIGGNRLKNCSSLLTKDFKFAAALNDRILVCDNEIIYEVRHNKEDKSYELLEIYSDGLPEYFTAYLFGRSGAYLVGSSIEKNVTNFWTFGKDNVFKEFASVQNVAAFSVCQDDKKVYVLTFSGSGSYKFPDVYIYNGKTTTKINIEIRQGLFTRNVAIIKRNDKFVIYEMHDNGGGKNYIVIWETKDFLVWDKDINFEKCIVPFPDGFTILHYNIGYRTYHKVAFVANINEISVDEDTYKVELPINAIKKQIPVYYDSGKIDHEREDMCLPFSISGFDQTVFLTAYLDNLYFEESEGNFGK